jgi:putative ATPase
MDLFGAQRARNRDAAAPLAVRMRPRTLDEFVGQRHFLAPGKLLRRMLEADRLVSLLFYGPPGTGKTTLAQIIATQTKSHFEQLNAASAGVKEVRAIIDAARDRLETSGHRTVLFLDEIHRFNRAQQDILLGDVESGVILLIGATTENPFFAVNSALVSRSQIFQFEPIDEQDIRDLLTRAISDDQRGLGSHRATLDEDALNFLATICDGDARRALTALEIAVLSQPAGTPRVTLEVAQESIQRKAIVYDATGDDHYDAASALIKSMRGSDPDAAIYWVARMLEAGEDPRFIARRIAILASEDIGNADPNALVIAAACCQIVERIGMPECQLTLGQTAIYMACAPKSNASARAIWTAMTDVREGRTIPVPRHLRDKSYAGSARLGHRGYQNPHDHVDGRVDQDYLGVEKCYYEPTDRGFEAAIQAILEQLRSTTKDAP